LEEAVKELEMEKKAREQAESMARSLFLYCFANLVELFEIIIVFVHDNYK